jgi:hypothetical protein
LGCEHRGADFDVAVEFFQRIRDLVDQRDVEKIQRWPLDFDNSLMLFLRVCPNLYPSCPGLSRVSTSFGVQDVDGRGIWREDALRALARP